MAVPHWHMAPQTKAVGGSTSALAGRLFNAENLVVTDKGRIFVTGGDTVFEIAKSATGQYEQRLIPLRVGGVPENCMVNGIAAYGDTLFLACAHVHKGNTPLIPEMVCDVNQYQQTGISLMLTYLAAMTCAVESYILSADLRQAPCAFTDLIAEFPDKFLANGLAVDARGEFLYIANSAPSASEGIYRIPTKASNSSSGVARWCRPGCTPNGVKVLERNVFYTGNNKRPFMSAVLGTIPIQADGSAGIATTLYTRPFAAFDDFALADRGLVVAHFSDHWALALPAAMGRGTLRFVEQGGAEVGVFNHADLLRPSAVAVVKADSDLVRAGDLVITEKSAHRVLRIEPDPQWRDWLIGDAGSAAVQSG